MCDEELSFSAYVLCSTGDGWGGTTGIGSGTGTGLVIGFGCGATGTGLVIGFGCSVIYEIWKYIQEQIMKWKKNEAMSSSPRFQIVVVLIFSWILSILYLDKSRIINQNVLCMAGTGWGRTTGICIGKATGMAVALGDTSAYDMKKYDEHTTFV